MISTYIKIAFRNLGKNKMHSFLNITGLSVGMAVAMLIGLWIWDELSFDHYHKNHDRIAQVKQHVTNNNEVQTWDQIPFPLAEELRKGYGSDFKYVALTTGLGEHMLTAGDKKLNKLGMYAESEAIDILSLKIEKGTRDFKEPSNVLISASTAEAYFGKEDPLNKLLLIDNKENVKVTGVYEDLPANTSYANTDFIATWQLFYSSADWLKTPNDPWRPNAFDALVQLNDNADLAKVSAKIRDVKLKNVNKELAKKKPALFLQGMNDWHLYSDFRNGINTGGRIQYVWMFGIIGVFILLLACINFMNLSTAKSEKKAKEVGIRKAIGSLRSQLIYQFFTESLLAVALSFVLALLFVQLMLPFFNEVADKKMQVPWTAPVFWLLVTGFSLVTGIIAGSYPAVYLSSFKPIKVLKGTFRGGTWGTVPRKVLVVVQFTVSITLIIGTIVVLRQIQYAKDRPVGYSRDAMVSVPVIGSAVHEHFDALKQELMNSGMVEGLAESEVSPTFMAGSTSGLDWKGKDPNLSTDFQQAAVSYDYGKTISWELKEGRDFSRDFATDSMGLILNETAVKFMNLQNPVGETIRWFGDAFTVIGVVKDMVVQSPYQPVRPSVFRVSTYPGDLVVLKIKPTVSTQKALAQIETSFKKFNPEQPFSFRFVDEEYARKFGNEERVAKLAGFFAALTIFISCLGLFGMAAFTAEKRIKEIGVRKVLGASVFSLWKMLSKDFVLLVIVSMLIAVPLAYYFMEGWLKNYQYRYTISLWVFLGAGTGALLITLLTVSYQSIKAALMNPVKSLRSE